MPMVDLTADLDTQARLSEFLDELARLGNPGLFLPAHDGENDTMPDAAACALVAAASDAAGSSGIPEADLCKILERFRDAYLTMLFLQLVFTGVMAVHWDTADNDLRFTIVEPLERRIEVRKMLARVIRDIMADQFRTNAKNAGARVD